MTDVLVDLFTERRLLAALIAEPAVLAASDDVESQDFSDPRHRAVLAAIRQLVADNADVDADEIHGVIRLWDLERGTHLVDSAGEKFLVELLLSTAPYRGFEILVDHDVWWLRELANRRRSLQERAA